MSNNTLLVLLQALVCFASSIGAIIGIVSIGEVAIIACITAGTGSIVTTLYDIAKIFMRLMRDIAEMERDVLLKYKENK